MQTLNVTLYEIAKDGLPDKENFPIGRVAFLWDGNIVNGWPILPEEDILRDEQFKGMPYVWECDSDSTSSGIVAKNGKDGMLFAGVTHWLLFPEPLWVISPPGKYVVLTEAERDAYQGGLPDREGAAALYLRGALRLAVDANASWLGGPYVVQLFWEK